MNVRMRSTKNANSGSGTPASNTISRRPRNPVTSSSKERGMPSGVTISERPPPWAISTSLHRVRWS